MSYVSLENSEPFLKCFEVIAEDKSCIVTDSVLYFSGKTGKGFVTVAGVATGIEVLAVNVSSLAEDFHLRFLPSPNADSYVLTFDEIEIAAKGDHEIPLPVSMMPAAERMHSSVSITDAEYGKEVIYPKDRVIRSLIVRVKKSSLGRLIHDFDAGTIQSILQSTGGPPTLSWPITFKYRLLLSDFMAEIVQHPFRELFTIRNISILVEYLLQQFFVMDKLGKEGSLSTQDTNSLCRVEQHLCVHYRTEFPGIEKLSRISAMSPTSLKTKFKKYYGETLFGYYQKNKLEHARKLLDSKIPVKVVATEIGYSNPSHFTLAFKKEYGFSPWHYLNPH